MAYLNVQDLRDEYTDLEECRGKPWGFDEDRYNYLTALFDALGSDKPDTLIPEEDFIRHVRDEAEEELPDRFRAYIDWNTFVGDARSDYTEIDVNGDTFLYRA